jgi:hypothetical protein
MKRNNLTTAILAGITGVAGIASVSTAVNLNPDGLGQVLIYPYYTVNNGLNTLISVVNTTDQTKAIKVRFLEGRNSRECLDFNLYMSPYDVWTAGLVPATATALFSPGNVGQDTVKIVTFDNSCTDPLVISGYEFLPFAFTGGFDDPLSGDLVRCTEGHFEMIEMGNIVNAATVAAVDHGTNGTPANCSQIVANYSPGGIWETDFNTDIEPPTGGIFGSASLIDVVGGVDVSYNADAIDGFTNLALHTSPGDLTPNLNSGLNFTSNVFSNASVVTDDWNTGSVQAVSAVYMHNSVFGEYVLSNEFFNAGTEWVVTFPTKNFYVDALRDFTGLGVPVAPFDNAISEFGACEVYSFNYYDREEQIADPLVANRPPSPLPPGGTVDEAVFCWETNVVEFENTERTVGDSLILGSHNTTHFITQSVPAQAATPQGPAVAAAYFNEGWAAVNFNAATQTTNDNARTRAYNGLPVTGFAIQRYTNSNLDGGVLANYAGLFAHRYSRDI